ncbi:MAG: histidine phosphatase family protein [Capsulimonadaceae bacterium]
MTQTTNVPRLYLIRHGETEWALSGRHTRSTDIPLTARGEERACQLGQSLRDLAWSCVLTSPRERARRTCEIAGLEPGATIEPDLAEWDYGDFEGLRTAEIHIDHPGWNIFRDGCPGGESPVQVANRADQLLARLRRLGGNIALFTHGHFGCILAMRWVELPIVEGRHFPLGTASLSILGYEPSHPDVPVIALWNAASHNTFDPVPCTR